MNHYLFSASAAHRWLACPGSMAFAENHGDTEGESSTFADNGTASHEWAASALSSGCDALSFLGQVISLNGKDYVMDEERAEYVQMYLDDVRRRALGGSLFVEQRYELSEMLGGTADAVVYDPKTQTLTVEDLKYGTGEKVYASYRDAINPQLGLYAIGALADMEALGYSVSKVIAVICQPRLGAIDEFETTPDALAALRAQVEAAIELGMAALVMGPGNATSLSPGDHQCRWCRAKAKCPALAQFVADEVRADFDSTEVPPPDTAKLAQHFAAVPLIEQWCAAVTAEVTNLVASGALVPGSDGKPLKFVEGKAGSRKWTDEKAAEAALIGQLGPKAYTEPKIITAPAAAKLLDKKATKKVWADVFEPLIRRESGKPVLALGSDTRAPIAVSAKDDFDNVAEEPL